jgi:DNA-binding response OmpR family regulator
MIKLLLVEDDLDLAGNVIDYLEIDDMYCDHASNGVVALNLMDEQKYQVIVLDINLPRLDGLQVCQKAREKGDDTPIIMLTARDQLTDKIAGFSHGADDYLVKPFAMEELVARVRALAKRRSSQARQLGVGQLKLDLGQKQVFYGDTEIRLSPTGFTLLRELLQAHPMPVARSELVSAVWGEDSPETNSLKVHIHHLRKALQQGGSHVEIVFKANSGFTLIIPTSTEKT